MIKTYKKALDYLNSFINYEKKSFFFYQGALKLERMQWLVNSLDIKPNQLRSIHIAGTKGKGSTANFCAYLLANQGYRVGLYTSPHIFDIRERIKIIRGIKEKGKKDFQAKESLISKKDFTSLIADFKKILDKKRLPKKLGALSFFELFTAVAFRYFIDKNLDFVILETGLGGRLDATNIARPLASIITHIGYDHIDKLGNRIADIAGEKAGIIKESLPVISNTQSKGALEVIKKISKKRKAELFLFGRDFNAQNIKTAGGYSKFDFHFKELEAKNIKIYLKGIYQVQNFSLSLAALCILAEKGIVEKGNYSNFSLGKMDFPARFEVVKKNPLTIVDIAHNQSSFSAVEDNLRRYFPNKKVILIFSCAEDKDHNKMLEIIDADTLIVTTFKGSRAYSLDKLKEVINREALFTQNIKKAYSLARKIADKNFLILISGSVFLVSQAKKVLKSEFLKS